MKLIISFVLLFSSAASAEVVIYKNDTSVIAIEKNTKGDVNTSTLYGGGTAEGASSPADCTVKFKLKINERGFSGVLLPFSTDLMGYSDVDGGEGVFETGKNGLSFVSKEPLTVCPLSTDFSGDYVPITEGNNEYKTNFNELFQLNYTNAVKRFHANQKDVAIELLEPYVSEAIMLKYYQPAIYNDYGYFLQSAGKFDESIKYFNIVKNRSPGRIVVYLNIADSYWAINRKDDAIKNYKKYINMMNASGKNNNIPERVKERAK